VNARDQIAVIAAKLEAAQKRRRRMLDDDIRALRCVNKVLFGQNGKVPSKHLTESLESLRESMPE